MTEITISVNGMRCGGCARLVALAIRKLPGVKSTQVDPKSETAVIVFDPRQTAPGTILRQIECAGFDASLTVS
ncbi:MAG: heavy-metal-associated domain-containing protein [Vulcanimicrobiaceae bacterium]